MRTRDVGGAVGDCYDNALCESFFATLECELLDRRVFDSRGQARMAVFEFIEGWYNPHRRHSSLGCDTPLGYERRHAAALTSLRTAKEELVRTGALSHGTFRAQMLYIESTALQTPGPSSATLSTKLG